MSSFGQYVTDYGPFAIGLWAAFEGETAAIAGGVMAHRGLMPPWAAFAATAIGAFCADQIFFQLGRRFRDRPFVAKARQKPAFRRAMAFVERHPNAYILIFRFLYGLRSVSPIAFGLTHVTWRRFVTLNIVACIVWSAIFTTVGYKFGPAVDRMLAALVPYKTQIMIAFPIPGICFVLWLLWRRRKRRLAGPPSVEAEA